MSARILTPEERDAVIADLRAKADAAFHAWRLASADLNHAITHHAWLTTHQPTTSVYCASPKGEDKPGTLATGWTGWPSLHIPAGSRAPLAEAPPMEAGGVNFQA